MPNGSRINTMLTLEYMQHEHENKYFDRKSAKIKPSELAPLISAFANAVGGTIVLGISDKTSEEMIYVISNMRRMLGIMRMRLIVMPR